MSIGVEKDDQGRLVITCGDERLIIDYADVPEQKPPTVARRPITPGHGVALWVRMAGGDLSVEWSGESELAVGLVDEGSRRLYLDVDARWPRALDVGSLGKAVNDQFDFYPEVVVRLGHGNE